MSPSRRLASACAAAGLVAASLATGPGVVTAATGSTGSAARGSASAAPALTQRYDLHLDGVRAKKRTAVSGWKAATHTATTSAAQRAWTFTVRVSGPKQRRVQLQQLVGGMWRTIAVGRTGTSATRAFVVRLTVPQGTTKARLRFPATKKYRSAVTPTKTFVVRKPGSTPVVPPPTDPPAPPPTDPPEPPAPSTHYAFLDGTAISAPADAARWNRCTTVRWSGDFTRATAGNGLSAAAEKARWDSVFAEVAAVSGYTFAYVDQPAGAGTIDGSGRVTGFSTRTAAYTSTDVVVTYAAPGDSGSYRAPDLAGNVIGYGGPMWSISSAGKRIVAGQVLIDYGDVTALSLDGNDLRSLYLHELGHALGLGHYSDAAQVMNPSLANPAVTAYADGDRNGLYALASQTCFTGAGLAALGTTALR